MRFLAIPLLFVIAQRSFSQGEYLKRGESAFAVGVALSMSKPVSAITGSTAISGDGTFDFGVSYSHVYDGTSSGVESTSWIFSPFASMHIVKQDEILPVSLSAHAGIQVYSFPGKTSGNFSTWSYAGSIFTAASFVDSLAIQPMVTVSSTKLPDQQDNRAITAYELSVSIVASTAKPTRYFFRPSVGLSEVEPVFSFGIGLVGVVGR